jgi:undecaprenyl-diphosphatase
LTVPLSLPKLAIAEEATGVEDIVKAIVLGIVQGLTEFLPISSSAHLVLVPWFLGWTPPGLAFDVALHLGTLIAVLFYFRRDWLRITLSFLAGLRHRQFRGHPDRLVALLVVVGTIPATVVGYLVRDHVEALTQRPAVVAAFLLITGVMLLAASLPRGQRRAEHMSFLDALLVGCGQALAILPGISRSGSTITVGLFRGLAPSEAARFSFLLSAPIIVGAALVEVPHLLDGAAGDMGMAAIGLGIAAAAVSGFLAIHYLLKLLARGSLKPFAVYCFIVGLTGIAYALLVRNAV